MLHEPDGDGVPRRLDVVAPGPRARQVAQLALLARLGARRLAHEVGPNNSHLALELVELQDLDQVGVSPLHGDGLGRLAVVVERAGVAAQQL